MIDEKKVIMMTKAAVYNEKEQQGALKIGSYLKYDYVTVSVIKAAISYTICFILIMLILAGVNLDYLITGCSADTIFNILKAGVWMYFGFLLIIVILSGFMYTLKAIEASRKNKRYLKILRKLDKNYHKNDN